MVARDAGPVGTGAGSFKRVLGCTADETPDVNPHIPIRPEFLRTVLSIESSRRRVLRLNIDTHPVRSLGSEPSGQSSQQLSCHSGAAIAPGHEEILQLPVTAISARQMPSDVPHHTATNQCHKRCSGRECLLGMMLAL